MTPINVTTFDPLLPQVVANPYPYYRWLRVNDPIHWGAPGDPDADGCWYITRYTDVTLILKDPRFGREIWRVLPDETHIPESQQAIIETSRQWMVLRDPPVHTRLRKLVHRVFTPGMIATLEPKMRAIANDLLDGAQTQGHMEVISDFAFPFAVIVIAELLGIPPDDRQLFIPWTKALAAVIEFKQTDDVQEQGSGAVTEINDYLRDIIAKRRRNPRNDLISALVTSDEEPPITEMELLGTCTQLLFGGNDPIAHMIGNGLLALCQHPEQLAKWRADPALTPSAVEEMLRYDSSVQMTFRYALEDVNLGGRHIRQGDQVAIVFGAANRDPSQFDHPDTLDITRNPNRHMSLGMGIHYCMGAALGRVEGQVAFELLLQRFPDMVIQTHNLEWNDTVAVRGLKRLMIVL